MRTVRNLSKTPQRVPLPGGKTLHLGPGHTASVRDGAAEHPALKRLCDSGVLELGDAAASGPTAGATSTMRAGAGPSVSGTRRQSGDR